MNVFKTTKMYSKILVVVLLAYFLDNYSVVSDNSVKPVSISSTLNGKNIPVDKKNTLVFNQPIQSHPLQPLIASDPTTLTTNGNENHQGQFNRDDDYVYTYEEESVEEPEEEGDREGGDEEDEEDLENGISMKINDSFNILQPNQPMISSSTSKFIVPESVKQENENPQGFDMVDKDDDYVYEYEEETFEEDDDDEKVDNDVDKSNYSLNEGHLYSYEWDQESSNSNNNPTDIFETLDKKNDYNKDHSINTNEFELNSNDNTQTSTEEQEENTEDQYVSENNERIIYGYNAIKKILYMLHDYASSIFNLIINKINYRMEQYSSRNIIK